MTNKVGKARLAPTRAAPKSKTRAKQAEGGDGREDVRFTAGSDPAVKAASALQLRRARGQIDGIERMILEDRYCVDVIVQIIAARASLQLVANMLLKSHLKASHELAASNGGEAADEMYQELVGLVAKMAK